MGGADDSTVRQLSQLTLDFLVNTAQGAKHMTQYVKLAIAVLALPVFLITGCEQQYRYPCQNPDNWKTAVCQKPACEVNRECPEHIYNGKTQEIMGEESPEPESKGTCK